MTYLHDRDLLPKPNEESGYPTLSDKQVTFLLGTDVHIGEPDTCEQRVAVTPEQVGMLKRWLAKLGIDLNLFVVSDAGQNAGFDDAQFQAEGAQIIEEVDLPFMDPAPDLVHALKEPTHYEATIAGPYLRIGALHSGDFKPGSGLAKVLLKGRFCGIFDGSAVGGFAWKTPFEAKPRFRIPLRSCMSVYAGTLAGEDVGRELDRDEKVIISGGGVVGTSAVNVLIKRHLSQLREIVIIEKSEKVCAWLRQEYRDYPIVKVKQGDVIEKEDILDAAGLILTVYVQGSAETPKVIDLTRLSLMKTGAQVVDVAIDEGGGVAISKDGQIDPSTGKPYMVTVEDIRVEVEALHNRPTYHADNHMPRRRPREASIEHGKTALMYLATLLYLCAQRGGPSSALKYITEQDVIQRPKNLHDAVVLDLKNGLAYTKQGNITVLYRQVLKKSSEMQRFLDAHERHNVFA